MVLESCFLSINRLLGDSPWQQIFWYVISILFTATFISEMSKHHFLTFSGVEWSGIDFVVLSLWEQSVCLFLKLEIYLSNATFSLCDCTWAILTSVQRFLNFQNRTVRICVPWWLWGACELMHVSQCVICSVCFGTFVWNSLWDSVILFQIITERALSFETKFMTVGEIWGVGARNQRKTLTIPAFHQEFIKGTYIGGVSWDPDKTAWISLLHGSC